MADNAALTAGDGTIVVATDKIAGVDYQRVKLALGADGVAVDAGAGAGVAGTDTQRVTLASDDPLMAAVGEVQASPTANTLLARLKTLATQLILPSALGTGADSASLGVAFSTEGKAQLGSLTETAPATDTASSGLNGRLQRIAQRITTFIALFPASLGAKTAAASFSVVQASDGVFASKTSDGLQAIAATQFARPGNTTAYAAGDLVADTVTAGSVAVVAIPNAVRAAGEAFRIERCRLRKSTTTLTAANFRVYICRALPTFSVGDNGALNVAGALAIDDIANVVGWFDITMDRSATAGARGVGVPSLGPAITVIPSSGTTLYAFIEATGAYAPGNAETFNMTLEGQWS